MVFSSTIFLFAFLPVALVAYYAVPQRFRNLSLLLFSIYFYYYGEPEYFPVLLASIVGNYVAGLILERRSGRGRLAVAIALNLGLLFAFKYAGFAVDQLNTLLAKLHLGSLPPLKMHLPAGVSFFTFQAISYCADVHARDIPAERNPVRYSLYASLFPHLVAGPIVRYSDIADQLRDRRVTLDDFAEGIRRFVVGLGKKVLIANTLAITADEVFGMSRLDRTTSVAWLGICCYALQIYFDFSGYSDMAIGLGRMFGFTFAENFNHPYSAVSVGDFWRRWHMSLSYWLRDYVYIPLGGNRSHAVRNTLVTFGLCGLWHGASWAFVVWGLWHGAWVVIERATGRKAGRLGTLLVVLVGWVPFRADSFSQAGQYLGAMAGFGRGTAPLADFLTRDLALALVAGCVCAVPTGAWLKARLAERWWVPALELAGCAAVVFVSVASLAGGSYSPFLYFRF
ncbi:MAG: MBOAT family protein [Gemmataceae bacterium]